MREYEILFFLSPSIAGIHIFRCKAEDLSVAYTDWASQFPFGIAFNHGEGWKANPESAVFHVSNPKPIIEKEITLTAKEKFEARRVKKNSD